MDHLHIPPSCRPNVREVPYLGIAPKYDGLGIHGFPERHGYTTQQLLTQPSELRYSTSWIEGFFQEWLWFGLLDEFGKAYGIVVSPDDFIVDSTLGPGKRVSTSLLYDVYARRFAVRTLDSYALNLGLEIGDLVALPYIPNEDAAAQIEDFWNRRAGRENPLFKDLGARSSSKLRKEYGKDTVTTDENGVLVPMHTLEQRVIACRILVSHITKTPLSGQDLYPERERFAESIAQAQKALDLLMTEPELSIIRLDITVSISILCHTLATIIYVFLDEQVPIYPATGFSITFGKMLVARNWCPSRLQRTLDGNTPSTYVASLLPSLEKTSHGACSQRKCLKVPTSAEAMIRAHRESCDRKCVSTSIPESELVTIWRDGGIPGVRPGISSKSKVEVIDCTSRPFIAISHVWAHGLGNHNRNEIPCCQFEFLSGLIQELGEHDAALWIDTLVVPNMDIATKRLAISKLRKIYTEAKVVLVVDRDLLQVGPDHTEQILQLLNSEWQRRLWTLQEGRLARDLRIQFKDKAVPVSELMRERQRQDFTSSNTDIFDFDQLLKVYMQHQFDRSDESLLSLTTDLAARSTTYQEDEPICLAMLFNLSLEGYDRDPKMEDVYRALPSIPQDWIFVCGQRLQAPGLTWAPTTFLQTEPHIFNREDGGLRMGSLSPEGLLVTKDCFLLNDDLDFRIDCSRYPAIYIITTSLGQKVAVQATDTNSPEGQVNHAEPSRLIHNAAMIWELPCRLWIIHGWYHYISRGVLVSRTFEKEDIIHCKFEMTLVGWHIRSEYMDFHEHMVMSYGRVIDGISAVFKEEANLCVG